MDTDADEAAFRYFRDSHAENMERMFAAVSDLYAEYWHDFFHFALFDSDDQSWDDAFAATHKRYLDALRAPQAERLLELACGRGGFADILARSTAGHVTAIDISRAQLAHARRHARPNLSFRHHDIMRVDELEGDFDAIAFMDADCYLPDKGLAVRRIASRLRAGGRFLLVAWCKADGVGSLQEELVLRPFMRYWGVPSLETPEGYRRHFAAAGLRLIEDEDMNHRCRRNWDFGYDRAIDGVRELGPAQLPRLIWKRVTLGAEGVRLIKEQFAAALYIKAAFDAGFLRYRLFLLER